MLRRYKNKSSRRLSRRKSTSSIHSKTESIDPQVARQHAQAAATYAYVRAQERASTDLGARDSLSRNDSTSSYPGHSYIRNDGGEEDQSTIRRKHSVRFAGPTALSKSQATGFRCNRDSIGTEPTALTNEVAVPAAYRPPSRSSSIGRCSYSGRHPEDLITSLVGSDEYYTHEDDVASTPSSYRRIQKSKSLTSQLRGSEILFNDGTPNTHYGNKESSVSGTGQDGERTRELRGPKSMSFLRGGRDHLTPSLRQEHDVAVQIARDKFLHQIEQQRLRQQPSFLFKARARRQEKPFPKTVRSSNYSIDDNMPIASDIQITEKKHTSIREKARKASQSLKNKIKGLFKRNGGDEQEKLISEPENEIRESISSSIAVNKEIIDSAESPFHHSRGLTLSQVSSRVPSLHAVPSNRQLRSRTGSVSSLRSTGSSKSRVTSWTTSAIDSTANSRYIQAERERQRLSIIQENGAHVPSSSFSRPMLVNQISPYPSINRAGSAHTHSAHMPALIDSQMVYSALMRRFDGMNQRAILSQRRVSIEDIQRQSQGQNQSDSAYSRPSSQTNSTPATIRHVVHERGNIGSLLEDQNQMVRDEDDVFSSTQPPDIRAHSTYGRSERRTSDASTVIAGSYVDPTPQEIALHNEPVIPKSKGLRETTSTFFGASSITNSPRSTSPYKRALAASDQVRSHAQLISPTNYSASRTHFNQSTGSLVDPAYSASIYSRTTSGCTPAPEGNNESPLPDIVLSRETGTAVLIEKSTYNSAHGHQIPAPGDSAEWKRWMSAQVSTLEEGEEYVMQQDGVTLPSTSRVSGHVRERAQSSADESDFEAQRMRMKIMESTQENGAPASKLRKKVSVSDLEIPIPPPPPIPLRSPLRAMPSGNSIRSIGTSKDENTSGGERRRISNGGQILHKRSDTALRSVLNGGKLIKKQRGAYLPPSPGILVAVENQFGSVGSKASFTGIENRNLEMRYSNDVYDDEERELLGPRYLDAQTLGSERMMDNFLSGRRRHVAGSDESNAFL